MFTEEDLKYLEDDIEECTEALTLPGLTRDECMEYRKRIASDKNEIRRMKEVEKHESKV